MEIVHGFTDAASDQSEAEERVEPLVHLLPALAAIGAYPVHPSVQTIVLSLADGDRPGAEKVAKTIVFLPLAISAVGSVATWRLNYDAGPADEPGHDRRAGARAHRERERATAPGTQRQSRGQAR